MPSASEEEAEDSAVTSCSRGWRHSKVSQVMEEKLESRTHVLPLHLGRLVREQVLLDPPRRQVALHPIAQRVDTRLGKSILVETEERLDDDANAFVAASSAKTGLVQYRDERGQEVDEGRRRDDGRCGRHSGEVRKERNLHVEESVRVWRGGREMNIRSTARSSTCARRGTPGTPSSGPARSPFRHSPSRLPSSLRCSLPSLHQSNPPRPSERLRRRQLAWPADREQGETRR